MDISELIKKIKELENHIEKQDLEHKLEIQILTSDLQKEKYEQLQKKCFSIFSGVLRQNIIFLRKLCFIEHELLKKDYEIFKLKTNH